MTMFLPLLLSLSGPILPDPIIRACVPPADMCAVLESDCAAAGVDPERCLELGQGVCPAGKCLACDRALDECGAEGGDCSVIAKHCDDALSGCPCEPAACRDVTELTLPQLFSTCFAWPMALGQCGAPSVGQCLTTLPWNGCAGLTTCEYMACMEDIAAIGDCDGGLPKSCERVAECVEAEAIGVASEPVGLGQEFDLTASLGATKDCLELTEIYPSGLYGMQWVRVRNSCESPVDLSGVTLRWTHASFFGPGVPLDGIDIPAGDCVTIGGPLSTQDNFLPNFALAVDMTPPLATGDSGLESVGLFVEDAALPFDSVVYGGDDSLAVQMGPVATGHSLWRVGEQWYDNDAPAPHSCLKP